MAGLRIMSLSSCPRYTFLPDSEYHVQMNQKDCSVAVDSAPFEIIIYGKIVIKFAGIQSYCYCYPRHHWSWTLSCDMHMTTLHMHMCMFVCVYVRSVYMCTRLSVHVYIRDHRANDSFYTYVPTYVPHWLHSIFKYAYVL